MRENAIIAFPVLPGSAEAQAISCGVLKASFDCLLYRNFLAKNIKIRSHASKLYSKPKVGRYFDTRSDYFPADLWDKIWLSLGVVVSQLLAVLK